MQLQNHRTHHGCDSKQCSRWGRAHQTGCHLSDHKGGDVWAAITANRRSTGTEATRSSLTFKTVAEREGCVVLEALHQHREAMSHPSSQAGAPLSHRKWGSLSENSVIAQVRHGHSMKISSFADSKSCILPQGTNNSQESLPHSPGCVCCPLLQIYET